MDRLPRKSFLVAGDAANAVLLAGMGIWLLFFDFSYVGYLAVSLLLACLGAVDELAFTSIYPELIPEGAEQKGYAVSSMLYPVLKVIMTPLAAILLDTLGVAWILIAQSGFSLAAAVTESFIRLDETERKHREPYSLRAWGNDIREAVQYLKKERGLRSIYGYMAVTNGVASGFSPILVAFFRTFPGFTAAMYSAFSVVEFVGRSIGSAMQYRISIPEKKRYGFAFFVYQIYEAMDMCLLWLPYPLMLVNRGICGFLGSTDFERVTDLRSDTDSFSEYSVEYTSYLYQQLLFGKKTGRISRRSPASGTAFPHRRMLYSLSDLCIARAKHHSGNCSRRKSYRGNSLIFYFSFRSQYAF